MSERHRARIDSAAVHLDRTKLPSRTQLLRRRGCHGTPLFSETRFYCGRRRCDARGKRAGRAAVAGFTATGSYALARWCRSSARASDASGCRSPETRAGPLGTSLARASLGLAPASLASAPLGLGAPSLAPSPLVMASRVSGLLWQLDHDPDPSVRVGAKWTPAFPRDKREVFARRSCLNN